MVVINQYFEKKRGVTQAGSGTGSIAISPLMLYTLDYFGLEGTMLIMGGIGLNIGVFGMLFRPAKFYCLKIERQLSLRKVLLDGTNGASSVMNAGFNTDGICDSTTETFDNPIIHQEDSCTRLYLIFLKASFDRCFF